MTGLLEEIAHLLQLRRVPLGLRRELRRRRGGRVRARPQLHELALDLVRRDAQLRLQVGVVLRREGIARDYTPFLLILQG